MGSFLMKTTKLFLIFIFFASTVNISYAEWYIEDVDIDSEVNGNCSMAIDNYDTIYVLFGGPLLKLASKINGSHKWSIQTVDKATRVGSNSRAVQFGRLKA